MLASPGRAQAPAPGESTAAAREPNELAERLLKVVFADDIDEVDAHFADFEALYASERSGRVDWSPRTWSVYGYVVAYLTSTPPWPAALQEPPRSFLERLLDDPTVGQIPQGEAALENRLGLLLFNERRYEEGLERKRRALDRPTRYGKSALPPDPTRRVGLWTDVAQFHVNLSDYGAALEALECAQRELDALQGTAEFASASVEREFELLTQRIRIQIEIGRPDRAALALVRQRELAPALPDEIASQQLLDNEVKFALAADDYERAIQLLEQARARLDGRPSPVLLDALGYAYVHSDRADADARAKEAFEAVLRHPNATPTLLAGARLVLASIATRSDRYDEAEALLECAHADVDTVLEQPYAICRSALAIERGERGADLLDERAVLVAAFETALAGWASIPRQPDGIGYTNYRERRELVSELIRLELAVDAERGPALAFEHIARTEALGSLARSLDDAPIDMERVLARVVGPQRGALVYWPGPERGYVFLLDESGVRTAEFGPTDSWRDDQARLVALLSTPPERARGAEQRRNNYDRFVQRLSATLLPAAAAAALARWDEVTIVGLDMLGYTPFECLIANGEELGLAKAITYSPSIVLTDRLAARLDRTRTGALFGLAAIVAPTNPEGGAERYGWAPIEWSAESERRLARVWNGEARIEHGDRANLALLGSIVGEHCAVLEILAHGVYDARRAPPVGLALAPDGVHDGYTFADELVGVRSAPIVALAVCGAARGPLRSGDDAAGHLGGAFLRGGASVVLLAAVDIEQRTTEALLDGVYDSLAHRGASVASALRDARRAMADVEATRDPYYRNLVHAVGLGHEHLVEARPALPKEDGSDDLSEFVMATLVVLAALLLFLVARARSRRRLAGFEAAKP